MAIGAVISQRRIAATTTSSAKEPKPGTIADNESDTNADTCCLGANFRILRYTYRVADVYAYDKSIEPIENVPIVSGVTAYDCPKTGQTYLLIINEGLYYGTKLDHSLLNPNQLRSYGVRFWDNPFDDERGLGIDVNEDLSIPLATKGTKVYFSTRAPTDQELTTCPKVDLTSRDEWNPGDIRLSEATTKGASCIFPWKRTIQGTHAITREYLDPRSDEAILDSIDPLLVRLNDGRQVSESSMYEPTTLDLPVRRTFVSTDRHTKVTAEGLSERFGIGIQRARATLRNTTQRGTRSAILPLDRRYRADRMFDQRRLKGKYSTDTAWFKIKSLRGNVASQIFFHKCGFSAGYHLKRANDENVGPTMKAFISDYGIPEHLTMDGAAVQKGHQTEFMKTIRRAEIKHHISHPYRPDQNPSEGGIREIKRRFYRLIQKHNIPMRLWDYVLDYVLETMNITVNSSRYADGRTPLEIITGITPDITEYLDFTIYDWVHFRMNAGLGESELGRWLGVSHRTGPLMTYWILPKSGIPVSCDTVQRVTHAEMQTDACKQRIDEWNKGTKPILEATSSIIVDKQLADVEQQKIFDLDGEDDEFMAAFTRVIDDKQLPQEDDAEGPSLARGDPDPPETDLYINMEIGLKRDAEGEVHRAVVKRRAVDNEGVPIGVASNNPITDTRQYEVEFLNGEKEILAANILAENILAQVDEEGHRHLLIEEIQMHRTDASAIPKEQGTYRTSSGTIRKKLTTRGWQFYVLWKDGSGDWIELKDLKESYPIELANYGKAHGLLDEPVFAWWASHVIKKCHRVISKVKSKYWERTHKYGIRVPKSVAEAKLIDEENGNTLWMDAIRTEMRDVRIAFEEYEGDVSSLVGYQEITGHLVFDVKLGENFRRKARYCADGHKTQTPAAVTYSTVVGRDSVRIMLLIAALNDLDILGADVKNAFLTAPNLEKCWMKAGPEFGSEEGKTFIVRRALYGLKSASASFRAFLAEKLEMMGFTSSIGDPDVWMRPAVRPNGEEYYEYVLAYVDDILAISHEPTAIMENLKTRFKFKNDAVEEPSNYLGARLAKKTLNGRHVWTMTSVDYIKAAIANVKEATKNSRWRLPAKATTPMTSNYVPELDGSPELDDKGRTYFQELIGILRWASEIGRVDILHEVSILSQYQACPRDGHMEQALHIFAFLDKKPKLTLYFDPSLPNIDYSKFTTKREEFKEHYRDAHEEMPYHMPKPRGRSVGITAFVDASHAANKKTRRSHTGYIIFVNNAPIMYYSKRQTTVEASTFSSEFIAMKTCLESITHLRFKLRMFGVPLIDDPAHVFCDNESVVRNSTQIESTLNKKHNSIAYHYVRWNVAAGIASISWIDGDSNLADAMTKRLTEHRRDRLFGDWTY